MSLLRYIDLTQIDKPFLDAGLMAKKLEMKDIAFVTLNIFIDIFELIEDERNQI